MPSKERHSVAVIVAFLLLSLIVFACCQSGSGDFKYFSRANSPVCHLQSFDWKTICDEDVDCPTRQESGLTTGHFMIGDLSRPDSIKKEAARVEKCYSYCMRTYPPTNVQKLAAIRNNPFTMDISSFSCRESLNASLCLSACLHHVKDQLQFTQHALVPSGSCTQLCAPNVQRGVCDRAFALRNATTLDEDPKWCNQFCRNETALCEHMCDETLDILENNILPEERLPVIREALPFLRRPSENLELWKNAVMMYHPQLESSFESNEVYGVLWEMSFTLYSNKSYIPQHMYLFFLPDEVTFYRQFPTLLSTPFHQCVKLDARFELIGLDPPHNELSGSEKICAQGAVIADPPERIAALATEFTDYVNLVKLIVHIAGHSPERHRCDNYLVSLDFYNDGTTFHKNFSKEMDTFIFEGSDLFWKGRSILDWHFDTKVSCVNWEEEEGFGVDPYNPPLFVRYSCDSTFRTVLYCNNNIQVSGLPVLEPIPNRHTGLWGVNVTITIGRHFVRPTKFLYLSEGQNLTFEMLDNDEVKLTEFIPLQIGKFEYQKTIPFIFPKGAHVGLKGTYGSESQTFLEDTDINSCNQECCISRVQKTFEHRIPPLPGIKPSSVRNFTILDFVINQEGVDENGDKGTINFSLRWIVPEFKAGGILMYRISFGIPQIPILGSRDILGNGSVTSTSNPELVKHTITTGLHRGEVFHFSIEAISIYDERSDSMQLEEIFIPAAGTPDPCCTNMEDMCSSLENMKAKIVSSDDISGSCDISDDCTTFTCNLVVVKNDFPVDFTLKVTLLPCSSPYAVELSLHAACDGAKVLMNDEMFNESRRVNVVLFVVDAVFVVNISQDCDGLTLSVSLTLLDNVINFIPSSKISMYCEGASCKATTTTTPQIATTATYSPSALTTAPVTPSPTPCCSTEEEMCLSLESIKTFWQDITVSSSALSGDCNVSSDCIDLNCLLQTGIGDFGISFYLNFALRPCATPYAVEIKAYSPIFANIFSESRSINISFPTVSSIIVGIKQQCNGLVLSVDLMSLGGKIVIIPSTEIIMYCESRIGCDTSTSISVLTTSLSSSASPSFMATPSATPTTTHPCLPTCSIAYCRGSDSLFCSKPGVGPCVLASCKACYYSTTERSRPSGCERFNCGRILNEDNQLCWKRLARCIRNRDRSIHGKAAKHLMKEEQFFRCYAL